MNCIPVIGLVGGVGSGKSTLARRLGTRRNVIVIDGDEIGHRVLEDPMVKDHIRRRFGNSVFSQEEDVDRAALGRIVFGATTEQQQARRDLQAIVHPRIREIMQKRIAEARKAGTAEAVILDAAVLLEAGWDELCDTVVFVETPRTQRAERVHQARGWDLSHLKTREESQLPLESKRNQADHIVDNTGPLSTAETQLEGILEHMIHSNG